MVHDQITDDRITLDLLMEYKISVLGLTEFTIRLRQITICVISKTDSAQVISFHQDIWSVSSLIHNIPFVGTNLN